MQVDPMQESLVQEGPICPFLLMPRKPEPPWTVDRMVHSVIAQCTQALKNLETLLDKAEQDAALKNYDIGVLMTSRLAPGQHPFIRQVQIACDYVKFAAARLSGQTPPKHDDAELTIGELRARIRKTVAYAESVRAAQYEGASERKVDVSWAPDKVIRGMDYLLQLTIPNTFFHVTTAYDILRHNGVDVGKMDYLDPVNLLDA
jgi:hypothetical protein